MKKLIKKIKEVIDDLIFEMEYSGFISAFLHVLDILLFIALGTVAGYLIFHHLLKPNL